MAKTLGQLATEVLNKKYEKPIEGIPKGDLAEIYLKQSDLSSYATKSEIPEVPVQDIQLNGTSIVNSGVANIPYMSQSTAGVATIMNSSSNCIQAPMEGSIGVFAATDNLVKIGTNRLQPIVPSVQHSSVFYGLAKAAGDSTQAASDNAVGTYTDAAKTAIRTMLGVAATADITVSDVQVNGTSAVSNGTANIPLASSSTPGVIYTNNIKYGLWYQDGKIYIAPAAAADIKAGTAGYSPIVPGRQEISVFYGLAKAAGDATQSASSNAVGTYTDNAKEAIRTMLGATSSNIIAVQSAQPTDADNKIWIPDDTADNVQVPTMADMETALAGKVGDVQVNGTTIVSNGVANIPIANSTTPGIMKVTTGDLGLVINTDKVLQISPADSATIKAGTQGYRPVVPLRQHESVFYGLAKAAGDTTQASSSNAVGTYTAEAKAAIHTMLDIDNSIVE